MFAGNFAPRGWAFCNGQLLAISQHPSLFSILGTTYGGDGRTTFALPDLRGRFAMHPGTGPGLNPRSLGQVGGTENVTLTIEGIPTHSHSADLTIKAVSEKGNDTSPEHNVWATSADDSKIYSDDPPDADMSSTATEVTIQNAGGGQAHNNIPPYRCVNFIIAFQGIYPSRS